MAGKNQCDPVKGRVNKINITNGINRKIAHQKSLRTLSPIGRGRMSELTEYDGCIKSTPGSTTEKSNFPKKVTF